MRYHLGEHGEYSSRLVNYHHFLATEMKGKSGKVLEIGCNDGQFLDKLKSAGNFQAVGFDIDPNLIRKCWTKKIPAISGDAETDLPELFPDESFDYIFLLETIAHFINPIKVLKECRRMLKKDGVLILESVNSAHWKFRLSYLLADYEHHHWFWGERIYNMSNELIWPEHKGTHLHHFSLDSMRKLLEEIGFEVEDASKRLLGVPVLPNLLCSQYLFYCRKADKR